MTDRSRLDPESVVPLDGLLQAIPGGFNAIPDIHERRATVSALLGAAEVPENPNVSFEEHMAPGPAGDIKVWVYSPKNAKSPTPGIVYIHGGGMIMGSVEADHATAQMMCDALGATIASVDYRKAPENPSPAATEDVYAATQWFFDNAEELGVDKNMIGAYGQSAGGGLAISLALKARDAGGPDLKFMAPIYPMIDHRNETHSSKLIDDVGIWDRAGSMEAWDWYLGGNQPDQHSSPALAQDVSELPPTYMDVGEMDMFRDEDLQFVQRLLQADVRVEFHVWPGAYHASEIFAADAELSKTIWSNRLAGINRVIDYAKRMS